MLWFSILLSYISHQSSHQSVESRKSGVWVWASLIMGFPVDRFVDKNVKREFLCQICHDVLEDPTVLEPCEHAFCMKCCDEWKTKSNTCPMDRRQIEAVRKPQRLFFDLLNGLEMRCRFQADGCAATLSLGDMKGHEERCAYNPENQKECGGRCGAILNRINHRSHNCVVYLKEKLMKLQTKDDEVKMLKEELDKYRKKYGPLGSTNLVASSRPTSSAQPTASSSLRTGTAPSGNASVSSRNTYTKPGWPYEMSKYRQETLEGIISTKFGDLKNYPASNPERYNLEEHLEATLNSYYTQEVQYGPNTFWRVGLINRICTYKLLQASLSPCPCHRGKNEHNSQHFGGKCSGGDAYKVLSTHNFTDPKFKFRVRICHYIDMRKR